MTCRIIWWLLSRLFPYRPPHPGWTNVVRGMEQTK